MTPHRLALACTLALACLLQPLTPAQARLRAAGLQTEQIEGRDVLLQPPTTLNGASPQALLVVLHGGGATPTA